jgi:predicted glycosyltransferase
MRDGVHQPNRAPHILFYSHDTFGLGHLRRSRAIAEALVSSFAGSSALILTGSPVAGRFTFPPGVDHIRMPGVVKTIDAEYISESLNLDIEQTTALRASVILAAAVTFNPDLVIVDKEPAGFRGELTTTLEILKEMGRAKIVLGIRDILDSPDALSQEWDRKGALDIAEKFYDQVWVYGDESTYNPLASLDLSESFRQRMRYTGYLRRVLPHETPAALPDKPYVLVTPGGGGDGEALVDWTLRAYENDPSLQPDALIVYGPFLNGERRTSFDQRVAALEPRVTAVGFDSRIEGLMRNAVGVVAMGGYNTFCEILSFDCRAVIAPRTVPRMEQHIRASVAEKLGLVRMLDRERDGGGPEVMARAIRELPLLPQPSGRAPAGFMDGLDRIIELAGALLPRTKAAA